MIGWPGFVARRARAWSSMPLLGWGVALGASLFSGALLLSCHSHPASGRSLAIIPKDPLRFVLGFPVMSDDCGALEDRRLGERTFYFYNTATWKILKRFDRHGRLLQLVPLDPAVHRLGYASRVCMVHPDTILVFSEHCDSYVVQDSTGAILRAVDLTDQLTDSLGRSFTCMPTYYGGCILPTGLVLRAYCSVRLTDGTGTIQGVEGQIADFGARCRTGHLALLDDPLGAPKLRFAQQDYYYRCSDDHTGAPHLWIEGPVYACTQSNVYLWSAFSPWVHRLDTKLATIDSFTVTSAYGPAMIQTPPMDAQEYLNAQEVGNMRARTKGQIRYVIPWEAEHLLLAQVVGEVPEAADQHTYTTRPWSYVIYDEHGTRSGETRFSGEEYQGHFVLQDKDHLWVRRIRTPEGDPKDTYYFDQLTITP